MKSLPLFLLSGLCLGVNCGGPIGFGLPVVNCSTTYFNGGLGVGFSPPNDALGPTDESFAPFNTLLKWDADSSVYWLSITPPLATMEIEVALRTQSIADLWPIERSEPFRLNSGQDGWIIVGRSQFSLNVNCGLRWRGQSFWVSGLGFKSKGADDLDLLLGVARTLCVE